MKKILSTLITATLISSCTIPVMASTVAVPNEKLEGNTTINTTTTSNDITVELNGKKLDFEVSPQIINDTTMVPMRTIFENLGYNVVWHEETKSVEAINSSTNQFIIFFIDYRYMVSCPFDVWMNVGDQEVMSFLLNYSIPLDVAPTIIDGNTLVPVRAISEASGYNVEWDSNNRTVIITSSQYAQTTYADITNEITQINNYINDGLYLEAINLCDTVKATFNLSDEDKNLVDNLKTTAQTKYNTYINETQKNNYYPKTNIQTYTSVTGYDCIQSKEEDNSVIYRYPYNSDGVSMYIDYLTTNGWEFFDKKTSDDYSTLYYSESYNLIGISIIYRFNEVWIVIAK